MATIQDGTTAELQRAIAELRQELRERDAALAQRNTEFGERIEHQAATIDVLKAMSASPGDPQPVFDLITRRATELFDVPRCSIRTKRGTVGRGGQSRHGPGNHCRISPELFTAA